MGRQRIPLRNSTERPLCQGIAVESEELGVRGVYDD